MKPSVWFLCVILSLADAYPEKHSSEEVEDATPKVTTPLGEIHGSTLTTLHGKTIYSFRGIRYAKPPIGELRFKPPIEADNWSGVLNATQEMTSCPQPFIEEDETSEDCLMLNVFTTKLAEDNTKRPVIVYFHAGGYIRTVPTIPNTGPQYLLDEDVVLVVPNYRLGTLGFMSTGDGEAAGNYGLKDQTMALRWVKDNVGFFGGNSDCVTIMGYSAGGSSVTLHLVSPLSKGLFHRAIAMSGSSFGNWPVPTGQMALAKRQAQMLDCPQNSSNTIMNCFRTKTPKELVDSMLKLKEFGDDPIIDWYPVVEPEGSEAAFLPHDPIDLILKGQFEKVPVLTGINQDEFIGRAYHVIGNATLLDELNKDFGKVAPIAFLYEGRDNADEISAALKKYYFDDKPLTNSSLNALGELYSDAIVGFATHRVAKLISEHSDSPLYYYKFDYKGRYSYFYKPDSNNTTPHGVAHADELIYLFYNLNDFPMFTETDPESKMVKRLTDMWTNFARTGHPIPEPTDDLDNVKWPLYTSKMRKYMDIGDKLVAGDGLFHKRYAEWEKLFPLPEGNDNHNHKHG